MKMNTFANQLKQQQEQQEIVSGPLTRRKCNSCLLKAFSSVLFLGINGHVSFIRLAEDDPSLLRNVQKTCSVRISQLFQSTILSTIHTVYVSRNCQLYSNNFSDDDDNDTLSIYMVFRSAT